MVITMDNNIFTTEVEINNEDGLEFDITSEQMPARAFLFTVIDEIGQEGFLVRKIYVSPDDPYLKNLNLSSEQINTEVNPEKYGIIPKDVNSSTTVAEHTMGNNKSNFTSTSSIFPDGSPRFDGRSIFIDIDKVKKSGATLVSTEEIIIALNEYKLNNKHLTKRIDKFIGYISDIDKEVLVKGKIPASAIFNEESLSLTSNMIKAGRVVQVFGIAFTAYDLGIATDESIKIGNVKPISAEVIRQAGGWGGAVAGMKFGASTGALIGIETGPGAIITGAIGGVIGGAVGYFSADFLADYVYEN